jgi:hypothetical protein
MDVDAYRKLTDLFISSDFESFTKLMNDENKPITSTTASNVLGSILRRSDPSKKEFVKELCRAGGTVEAHHVCWYLDKCTPDEEEDVIGFIEYDSDIFQLALDHVHPRDPDSIGMLMGHIGVFSENDTKVRVFRFLKQENYVANSRGYNTFDAELRFHCRVLRETNTPDEHVAILTQAGIDVAEYPFLLSDSLMASSAISPRNHGIPRALVNAGIPLSAAYDHAPPEYLDNQWYLDAIAREFPED